MRLAAILRLLMLGVGSGALGQGNPAANQPAPQSSQAVMPDTEKVVLLLRTILNTLNDALQTGDFTVLRGVGAPGFRDVNNAAKLSQSCSNLASRASICR